MGRITTPQPAKLIIGFIYRDILIKNEAISFLKKHFGKIDFQSPELNFDYTDYYFPELGAPLKRAFISFAQLKPEDELAGIKLYTNKLEKRFQLKNGSTTHSPERAKGVEGLTTKVNPAPRAKARGFTGGGVKRRINIDPGFLSLGKLILATTKDQCHRVYLGKGIFAEATLFYKQKTFNPWPWTYPDYQSREYLEILNSIRGIYQEQIKTNI